MAPDVSVFIVNYNTKWHLKRCLAAIFAHTGNLEVEVFVADNGSTDGSCEMIQERFPKVSLYAYERNLGYSSAVNPLIASAQGAYYLFLHPDLELLPKTLERMVAFLETHNDVGVVGANLYYPDGTPNACEVLWPCFRHDLLYFVVRVFKKIPLLRSAVTRHNPTEWSHGSTCRVKAVWNACMIVRRKAFEEIGGIDEDFFYGCTDWDLCKRMGAAGWGVYYLAECRAIHYERQSFDETEGMREEIRYKIDGWYSAPWIYGDRFVFLRKHENRASVLGTKVVYLLENVLRMSLIVGGMLVRGGKSARAMFQMKACVQCLKTILRA